MLLRDSYAGLMRSRMGGVNVSGWVANKAYIHTLSSLVQSNLEPSVGSWCPDDLRERNSQRYCSLSGRVIKWRY